MSVPIIEAAQKGDAPLVRVLLQSGVLPDQADAYGETALTWAAHLGHTAIVKDLLAAGGNREASGSLLQGTPLLLAARNGQRGIVALLAVLANANARDPHGATPLMLALQKPEGTLKPQSRILSIIKTLLDAGADPDLQDHEGHTALMWAVRWDNLEAARLLLAAGASPHLRNDAGQTALEIADQYGQTELVRLLRHAAA